MAIHRCNCHIFFLVFEVFVAFVLNLIMLICRLLRLLIDVLRKSILLLIASAVACTW